MEFNDDYQGFPSEIYLRGHISLLTHILGDIWGNFRLNCLKFTENMANFKGHQCLKNKSLGEISVKKGPSLTFLWTTKTLDYNSSFQSLSL